MPDVLVTGAKGFVGKNLCAALRRQEHVALSEYDLDDSPEELRRALAKAEVVFHLAGVNRPKEVTEFETGNAGFTIELCSILRSLKRAPKIVLTSSIQAELDNPYGVSKRQAEEALRDYAAATGAETVVYRLKNLFGKWSRPNYNSVTATFCHNIAHDLPISISDPAREMELTYIDDVVSAILGELLPGVPGFRYAGQLVSYRVTLGELAETIRAFRQMRSSLQAPDFSQPFTRALYATYVSCLDRRISAIHWRLRRTSAAAWPNSSKRRGSGKSLCLAPGPASRVATIIIIPRWRSFWCCRVRPLSACDTFLRPR